MKKTKNTIENLTEEYEKLLEKCQHKEEMYSTLTGPVYACNKKINTCDYQVQNVKSINFLDCGLPSEILYCKLLIKAIEYNKT